MKNLILVLFTLLSFSVNAQQSKIPYVELNGEIYGYVGLTMNKDSVFLNDDGVITVVYDAKRNTKTFIVRKNFERENIIFLDCTKKEDEDER